MACFSVTGIYRQEIHASIDAESTEDAAKKAMAMFEEWLVDMKERDGISLGPEEPWLDEDVLVTQAKDSTPEDPRYWTETQEVMVLREGDEYSAKICGMAS